MILFIIGLAQNALTGNNRLFDLLFLLCKAILVRARINFTFNGISAGDASSHQVIGGYSGLPMKSLVEALATIVLFILAPVASRLAVAIETLGKLPMERRETYYWPNIRVYVTGGQAS
jgi:hypothetical protein